MSTNRVLFDAPGPKARRRVRVVTAVTLLLAAGLVYLALHRFSENGQLTGDRWHFVVETDYARLLWEGFRGTLECAAVAAVIAFPAGAVLALLRLARTRPVRWLATGYIELFRSIPLLLLVFVFLTSLPGYGLNLPIFWKLTVPIAMVNAAVLAEVFRAGVQALDRGQGEAAAAIGLTYWQSMRIIVLPQAIRLVLPALVTQLVSLLKDSTLGYVVGYIELMHQGDRMTVYLHLLIQPYLVIAVIYVLVNVALSRLASGLERYLNRRRRAAGAELAPDAVIPALT